MQQRKHKGLQRTILPPSTLDLRDGQVSLALIQAE